MLRNLLLRNQEKEGYVMNSNSKYAIWTGDGGYFAGAFGGGKDFRQDPMMAVKYDTKHEAEQAADKLGFESPDDYEIRQVE